MPHLFRHSYRAATAVAIAVAAATAGLPAHAGLIDFEPASFPGGSGLHPGDNAPITGQYAASDNITFNLIVPSGFARLEAVGNNDPVRSFVNDTDNDSDTGRAGGLDWQGNPYSSDLGGYFLRSETDVAQTGDVILEIQYSSPVRGATGEIWDIDGTGGSNTEQWEVTAYDAANQVVDTVTSPLGVTNGPSTLDARPWLFGVFSNTANIDTIRIAFVGQKTNSVGLAFDNFNSNIIPTPAAVAAGAGLLAGLAARRRR